MARRKTGHASVAHKGVGGTGPNIARVIVAVTCAAAIAALVQGLGHPGRAEGMGGPAQGAEPGGADVAPAAGDLDPAASDQASTPGSPHIGIVAGHWNHDSGAVCADGLEEIQVNLDIAQRVVQSLRGLGYRVDLLEEYDSRLPGYLADALVSIHADSCQQFPDATPAPTGFKVASVVDSYVPEEERRLVTCLREEYAARTGLGTHDTSVTGHMTRYHTFYEIDGRTPGAIIEMGFLWLDRELLTQRPDLVAQGIVDGIICFIEGD